MDLRDRVVVVTGASSGNGRAAAVELARRGAHVVLAARREPALREVAAECEAHGPRALAVATDMTVEEQVERLAERAVDELGGLDGWVNNAAVTLYARFEDAPRDAYKRVIETNLVGYLHGAWAALPRLRASGGGVLVNVASAWSHATGPYASAYIQAKWALRALGECLRAELHGSGIEVATVYPASIDTPLYQHAGNVTRRAVRPLHPVNSPDAVAHAIAGALESPRRAVFAGRGARAFGVAHRVLPAPLWERAVALGVDADHFLDAPAPPTRGNLFEPSPAGTAASGGWRRRGWRGRLRALAGA